MLSRTRSPAASRSRRLQRGARQPRDRRHARPDRRLFSRLDRKHDHGPGRSAALHSARAVTDRRDRVVGSTVFNLTLLLGLTSWVAYGRVARAMSLTLREREFVLSAITQGATPAWNIRKHMLPNVLPQMLIVGTYELGAIIVLEAALSYLGLGVQPPLPSWGLMISEGQSYLEIESVAVHASGHRVVHARRGRAVPQPGLHQGERRSSRLSAKVAA